MPKAPITRIRTACTSAIQRRISAGLAPASGSNIGLMNQGWGVVGWSIGTFRITWSTVIFTGQGKRMAGRSDRIVRTTLAENRSQKGSA